MSHPCPTRVPPVSRESHSSSALTFQGFSSDGLRFLAFFFCFSLQLVQLVLCCFSDHRTLSDNLTYNQVQSEHTNTHTHRSTDSRFFTLVFRGHVQKKTLHFCQSSSSSGSAGKKNLSKTNLVSVGMLFVPFFLSIVFRISQSALR